MDSVPAWILVLNTVLVGGFGFAGAWVATWSQGTGRRFEARRSDAAIMRDMAVKIFEEIELLRVWENACYYAGAEKTAAEIRAAAFATDPRFAQQVPSLARVQALLAVYYPDLIHIMSDASARIEVVQTECREELLEARAQGDIDKFDSIAAELRSKLIEGVWAENIGALAVLADALAEEVRPHLPGALRSER